MSHHMSDFFSMGAENKKFTQTNEGKNNMIIQYNYFNDNCIIYKQIRSIVCQRNKVLLPNGNFLLFYNSYKIPKSCIHLLERYPFDRKYLDFRNVLLSHRI